MAVRDRSADLGREQDPTAPATSLMEMLSQSSGSGQEVPNASPTITSGSDIPARGGETPRESPQGAPTGGASAAPSLPMSPTPQAGSSFTTGGGPVSFPPMGGGNSVSSLLAPMSSSRRGLYGSLGGLKGGGLGVPLDPTSNQASDPISGLISMLESKLGKRGGY